MCKVVSGGVNDGSALFENMLAGIIELESFGAKEDTAEIRQNATRRIVLSIFQSLVQSNVKMNSCTGGTSSMFIAIVEARGKSSCFLRPCNKAVVQVMFGL